MRRHKHLYEERVPPFVNVGTYAGLIVLLDQLWKVIRVVHTGNATIFFTVPVTDDTADTAEAVILKLRTELLSELSVGVVFDYEFQNYKYDNHLYDEAQQCFLIITENIKNDDKHA